MAAVILLILTLLCETAFAQAQGGFLENTGTAFSRLKLTSPQISAFMPATRTCFDFPSPYGTKGCRLTIASDCGGQDCVNYHGYSYWMKMNNHVGQAELYFIVGLSQLNGGPGMTLFKFHKTDRTITKLGNLFPAVGWATEQGSTGETWYFSYTLPTKFYYPINQQLKRYDILAQTAEVVVDITNRSALLPDGSSTSLGCVTGNCPRRLWAWHSSADDTIHGGALQTNAGADLGCLVYLSGPDLFRFYPQVGTFNECILDRTGQYTMIEENLGLPPGCVSNCDMTNRIFQNVSGGATAEVRKTEPVGNVSHVDTGYGYIIGQDGHGSIAPEHSRSAYYPFTNPTVETTVHYSASSTAAIMNHITHSNAVPIATEPLSRQFFCGSTADTNTHENDLTCARADGVAPLQQLIVAPLMSRLTTTGGNGAGCSDQNYCKLPKGALDVSGRYFMWSSNAGGSRLDMFLVEVPSQLLVPDPPPPPAGIQRFSPGINLRRTSWHD